MRTPKTATIALATALTLGAAGTATAAFAANGPDQQVVTAPAQAPDSQQKLTQQVKLLQNTNQALKPVNDLLRAVLEAENGKLTRAQAERHSQAVKQALQRFTRAVQNQQENQAYQQGAQQNSSDQAAAPVAAAELTVRAAHQVQQHVNALVRVSRAGQQARTQRQAEAVVKNAVNLMTSVVLGGQLPKPDMDGLPELQLPQNDAQGAAADQSGASNLAPVG